MNASIKNVIHPFVNYSGVKRATLDLKVKEDIELILSMANNGWYESHPVLIVKDLEATWKAIYGEAEMPSRELPETFEAIEIGGIKLSSADVKAGFETVSPSKGKLRGAVSANRRFAALPYANAIRLQRKDAPISEVPYLEKVVLNLEELIAINLTENRVNAVGRKTVDWTAKLVASRALFEKGYPEAAIQRTVCLDDSGKAQRGQAQNIYAVLSLSAQFPELGVVDDIINGVIPMLKRDECKLMMGLDEATVQEMLVAKQKGETIVKKVKGMSTGEIETLANQCPVVVVKIVCQAILSNDRDLLSSVLAKAQKLNAVMDGSL